LLLQQLTDEGQIVFRNVERRVGVKRSLRRDELYAGRFSRPFHREIGTAAQLFVDPLQVILRAFEGGLDRELRRLRRTQAGAQQLVHALEIGVDDLRGAGGDAPADAPSGHEIRLGETVEGDAGNVGRQGCDGDVFRRVVED